MIDLEQQMSMMDLGRQLSITEILWSALKLYRRYPLSLLILALPIVLVYDAVVLVGSGHGPFGHSHQNFVLFSPYDAVGVSMLAPLISALYVRAVASIDEGGSLRLGRVAHGSLQVLPVVLVAEFAASLGIVVGFLFLFVPGIVLLLRWSVVAQVAAIENVGWLGALRRSGQLVAGHYWHVFGVTAAAAVLSALPAALGAGAISVATGSTVGVMALEIAIETVIASFGALALTMLYFDLCARRPGSSTYGEPLGGSATVGPA